MESFVAIRELAKSLAAEFQRLPKSLYDDLVDRSRVISEELSASYWDRVPGSVRDLAPHFEVTASGLRTEWNNIPPGEAAHQQLCQELEAAWALTEAWNKVTGRFQTLNSANFLDELFGVQVAEVRGNDVLAYEHFQEDYRDAQMWPLYLILSLGALAVFVGDLLHGNSGSSAAAFGAGGVWGLVFCGVEVGIEQSSGKRVVALEKKWAGVPTRCLPDRGA